MSAEENKKLVCRFYEEVLNKKNLAMADLLLDAHYILHDPASPHFQGGPAGFKKCHEIYFTAFPDLRIFIEDQIAHGDKVVTRWTMKGTHQGDLPGISATGEPLTMSGISIIRIIDGILMEEWTVREDGGLLRDLGIIDALCQAPPSRPEPS